jgi:hypothetical protein
VQSDIVALILAIVAAILLVRYWKRVAQLIVACLLALMIFGFLNLLQLLYF